MVAALRHHGRGLSSKWTTDERFEREILADQESPVLRSFKDLQTYLDGFDDLQQASAARYLAPFLDLVRSDKADASITMAALQSLNKFLLYGFISDRSPGAAQAINHLAYTLPRCRRFSDGVLMILLDVTDLCVQNTAGRLISGDSMNDLFQVCFRICQDEQNSYPKLLQQSAGSTLAHIIIRLYSRLGELIHEEQQAALRMNTTATSHNTTTISTSTTAFTTASTSATATPYGTKCLHRLIKFLVSHANPRPNTSKDKAMNKNRRSASAATKTSSDVTPRRLQILSLGMLNTVLETAGENLGLHDGIIELIQGDLCKFLLQSSQTDDPILLSLVLRTIFNMFCAVKSHLKVQFEVFFTSIHIGIVESNSATPPQKELALESLLDFCREPILIVDLYTNYDCDVLCTNLFEVLTTSLCAGASPLSQGDSGGNFNDSGTLTTLTTLHTLAFECLLEVLNSIGRRCQSGVFVETEGGTMNTTATTTTNTTMISPMTSSMVVDSPAVLGETKLTTKSSTKSTPVVQTQQPLNTLPYEDERNGTIVFAGGQMTPTSG